MMAASMHALYISMLNVHLRKVDQKQPAAGARYATTTWFRMLHMPWGHAWFWL
jgi:hypothetical protein